MKKSWNVTTLILSPIPISKKEYSARLEELTHILYDEFCQLQKSISPLSLTNVFQNESEAQNEK